MATTAADDIYAFDAESIRARRRTSRPRASADRQHRERSAASRQFAGLEELWKTYRDRGPSSSASRATSSARGTRAERRDRTFCSLNYGVTFR
jgi:hypothetical protein